MQLAAASSPGEADKENEDWAGTTLNVAVVLDGLSSAPGANSPCRHGTPWFVRNLGVHLLAAAQEPGAAMQDALAEAIQRVASAHQECDATADGAPSATVACIRVRPDGALDYLILADARIVLRHKNGEIQVLTDERVDDIAKSASKVALSHPIGSASQRQAVANLIETQKPLRNQPDGYWVASADPSAAQQAFSGCLPSDSIAAAALLSDGASRIVDVFKQLSWSEALEVMRNDGLHAFIRRVRDIEQVDPQGLRWPRFKQSDDATIVFAEWGR